MLHVCFNTVHIKHVLQILFQPSLRKFLLTGQAINRVLTLCHLLDNSSTTKKCPQELEMCVSAGRLLRAFGSLNKALGYIQVDFSNLPENKLFPHLLWKAFC